MSLVRDGEDKGGCSCSGVAASILFGSIVGRFLLSVNSKGEEVCGIHVSG